MAVGAKIKEMKNRDRLVKKVCDKILKQTEENKRDLIVELSLFQNTSLDSEQVNYIINELFCNNVIEQMIREHGDEFFNEISGYSNHHTISEKKLQMYLEMGNVESLTELVKCKKPTPFDFEFNTMSLIEEMVFDNKHKNNEEKNI